MSRIPALAVAAATVALVASFHSTVQAQPEPSLTDVPLARLQRMVVSCDLQPPAHHALSLDTAFCTFAAAELGRRAFDGEHERLLAWWRDERARLDGGAAPATDPATAEQLKSTYLQCERLAQSTRLDFSTAAHCSVAYEALKQRVFAGDYDRLFAWWQQASKALFAEGAAHAAPQ